MNQEYVDRARKSKILLHKTETIIVSVFLCYYLKMIESVLVFLGLLIVFVCFLSTLYAAIFYAPFVATPKSVIREALQIAELRKGEIFYDLGSGNGKSLIIAAKEFGARAFGFELSFQHYLISKINIALHQCSKTALVFWKNFMGADIGRAEVVFMWLTPKAFPKLEEKFKKELQKGARVVVYSSPIEFWNPDRVINLSNRAKLYLYTVK